MEGEINLTRILGDENRLTLLLEQMTRMDASLERIAGRITGITNEVEEANENIGAARQNIDAARGQVQGLAEGAQQAAQSFEEMVTGANELSQALDGTLSRFERLDQRFQGVSASIASIYRTMQQMSRESNITAAGQFGLHMQQSAGSQIQSLLGQIPWVGPLLLIGLNSLRVQDRASLELRQTLLKGETATGGMGSATALRDRAAALGLDLRNLQASGAIDEGDFLRSASPLMGIAMDPFGGAVPSGTPGRSIDQSPAYQALMKDKMFGLTEGTSSGLIAGIMRDTGKNFDQAISSVDRIGRVAHGAGLSMEAFANSISQATASLRIHGSDANVMTKTLYGMSKAFQSLLPGRDASNTGALAQEALGQSVSWATSMPIHLQAVLGRQVARQMGVETKGMSDLDIIAGMRTGFAYDIANQQKKNKGFVPGDFTTSSALSMYEYGRQHVAPEHMHMFLTQVGGMQAQLAEFLIRSGGKGMKLDAKGEEDFKKLIEMQRLEAEKAGPLNKSAFETAMTKVEGVMSSIGILMLQYLAAMVDLLAHPGDAIRGKVWAKHSAALDRSYGTITEELSAAGSNVGTLLQPIVDAMYKPDEKQKPLSTYSPGWKDGIKGTVVTDINQIPVQDRPSGSFPLSADYSIIIERKDGSREVLLKQTIIRNDGSAQSSEVIPISRQ